MKVSAWDKLAREIESSAFILCVCNLRVSKQIRFAN